MNFQEGKNFFFEKKKQKTFAPLGRRRWEPPRPKRQDVFCGAFFQKSDRFP